MQRSHAWQDIQYALQSRVRRMLGGRENALAQGSCETVTVLRER